MVDTIIESVYLVYRCDMNGRHPTYCAYMSRSVAEGHSASLLCQHSCVDGKVVETKAELINNDRCIVDRMVWDLYTTSEKQYLKDKALAKLTKLEKELLGIKDD